MSFTREPLDSSLRIVIQSHTKQDRHVPLLGWITVNTKDPMNDNGPHVEPIALINGSPTNNLQYQDDYDKTAIFVVKEIS